MAKHPIHALADQLCETLAEDLLQARTEAKLSKRKVSSSGGPSTQMVGYVEKRERRPKMDLYVRHALALGLLPSEVLALAEKRAGIQKPQRDRREPGETNFPTGK